MNSSHRVTFLPGFSCCWRSAPHPVILVPKACFNLYIKVWLDLPQVSTTVACVGQLVRPVTCELDMWRVQRAYAWEKWHSEVMLVCWQQLVVLLCLSWTTIQVLWQRFTTKAVTVVQWWRSGSRSLKHPKQAIHMWSLQFPFNSTSLNAKCDGKIMHVQFLLTIILKSYAQKTDNKAAKRQTENSLFPCLNFTHSQFIQG